jgi:hypothetical protein
MGCFLAARALSTSRAQGLSPKKGRTTPTTWELCACASSALVRASCHCHRQGSSLGPGSRGAACALSPSLPACLRTGVLALSAAEIATVHARRQLHWKRPREQPSGASSGPRSRSSTTGLPARAGGVVPRCSCPANSSASTRTLDSPRHCDAGCCSTPTLRGKDPRRARVPAPTSSCARPAATAECWPACQMSAASSNAAPEVQGPPNDGPFTPGRGARAGRRPAGCTAVQRLPAEL